MRTDDNKEENTMKMCAHKKKIAQLLEILSNLKELLQNIQKMSIDSFQELLTHKVNAILTDSTVNDLLNVVTLKSCVSNFDSILIDHGKHEFSSMYLTDVLRRCTELKRENRKETDENTETVVNNNMIRDVIWPSVMNRLDSYLNQRMKIKVDLKHITTEEAAMVDNIGDECVQIIIDRMLKNK